MDLKIQLGILILCVFQASGKNIWLEIVSSISVMEIRQKEVEMYKDLQVRDIYFVSCILYMVFVTVYLQHIPLIFDKLYHCAIRCINDKIMSQNISYVIISLLGFCKT